MSRAQSVYTTMEPAAVDEETAPAAAALSTSLVVGTHDDDDVVVGAPKRAPEQQSIRRASVRQVIDKKPALTVSFENLTVHVPRSGWRCCRGGGPIQSFAQEYLGMGIEEQEAFRALESVSGLVRTGEMLLVLGPNEMATSTLLRALTARSSQTDDLSGAIRVNGCPLGRDAWQGWRRMAPYVSSSDATHAAVLTVRETLLFAAQCMSDGSRDDDDYLGNLVDEMLEHLDIAHVADTVVGDENLRGISGGQKRRVTVGEMLMSKDSSFLGLENITDGLSSEDSFNLIHRLQVACKSFRMSAAISLLQPSDDIVELFDQLIVLSDDGQLAYFGPIDRVMLREIFLGPDAEPLQDSGSICDLVLSNSLNSTTDVVQRRFLSSHLSVDLSKAIATERASAASRHERDVFAYLPKQKYACSMKDQFRFIAARRLKLISRNAVTYTRVGIAVVFGCIIGSLFAELDFDLIGSLSRTGYLFLNCFLVLMLSSAITIPQTFRERVTLYKHRTAEFYSSRVAYYTQVILDIPLSVLEAVLLASISYFWVRLTPTARNFFYFLGVLIGLECVGQAFGRLLCAVARKQVYANTLSSVFLLIFGTVAGFMPTYEAIPPVLQWLSWLTPASYAFEGLMLNEFVGKNLSVAVLATDVGSIAIGEMTGEQWLSFVGIPRKSWGDQDNMKGFNIFILLFMSIVFDLFGSFFAERRRGAFFNQTRRPQKTTKSTTFCKSKAASVVPSKDLIVRSEWPSSLVVENIAYFVPIKGARKPLRFSVHSLLEPILVRVFGKKPGKVEKAPDSELGELQLLSGINAKFERGRMTALMGTSGAGKTTLLDVIAGYKTGGRIEGEVMIDGISKDPAIWKSISAYAEQSDILNPYLSVLETLRFTAACRLPRDVDKAAVVQGIVRLMGLDDWVDMVVGRELDQEGLPKHARKRLTIAVQLVTRPRILFADEPTTGLGTTSASLVVDALRRCTDEMGLITVATIHQPSKLIWDAFDDLLLLVAGGRTAYMGEMGDNSQHVLGYFESLSGDKAPSQINPADFVLSVVGRMSMDKTLSTFQLSQERESLLQSIDVVKSTQGTSRTCTDDIKALQEKASRGKSALKEFMLLTKRHFMTEWRNPSYCLMRIIASFFVSLYMGILFIGDKSELEGAVFSIGAIFFLVFVLVIPMQATVVPLIEDRAVLYREATSGMYSRVSYGLGQLAADIPFHLINGLVMFVTFYFLVGFRREGDLIGYFILMLFLANWVIMSLGQLFAFATPNEESANGLAGLSVILSVILMGFLITVSAMPSGWVWAYWSNLFHYIIQGFVTNELAGNEYTLIAPTAIDTMRSLNATSALAFSPGTDVSSGSVAGQAATFFSLVSQAGPGSNYDWENSGIVAVAALVKCTVENECLVEPLMPNFISCCVVRVVGQPPCRDEFDRALENVNITEVAQCFDSQGAAEDPSTGASLPRGFPASFSFEVFDEMKEDDQIGTVLCLLRVLLPPGVFDEVMNEILGLLNTLFNIGMIVLDIIENGFYLPGEVILYVFGWAEVVPGDGLVAPFKWWYCMFAVAAFLLGIELMKLAAVRFVVWTKR